MSPRTVRQQIASAIHIVLQLNRFADGKRRVVSVQEITGMEGEVIAMNEIFRFHRTSTDDDGTVRGYFEATGIRPKFAIEMASQNLNISLDLFGVARRLD
jgi:pilus assembly protein CpaF